MSDLLPPNATPTERALSEAMDRVGDVPVIVKQVWNPDTAPVNILPWLAWAFSVDSWDSDWTEQQKRNAIKSAVASQRIKGTIGAVKKQLSALGVEVEIHEWFNQIPQGDPYTFKLIVRVDQLPATLESMRKIIEIVNTNKNLRSHIGEITIISKTNAESFRALVTNIGNEIHLTNYVGKDITANDFNAVNNIIVVG